MKALRLTITLLGHNLVDIQLGPVEPPTPAAEQADASSPGPVTDRRTAPTLGFAAAALPRDRNRPVIR